MALVVVPVLADSQLPDNDLTGGLEKLPPATETCCLGSPRLILRGLRLLRLVRALRMISYFKVMWRLVYSLLTAGATMLSTTALLTLALFISGCVAVEVITKDEALKSHPVTGPIVEKYFANLFTSILTLLQFVTLDSIAAVYFPHLRAKTWQHKVSVCGVKVNH